jgi:hypothetical protein
VPPGTKEESARKIDYGERFIQKFVAGAIAESAPAQPL